MFCFHFLSFWPFGFSFPFIGILGLHKFVQVLAVATTIKYNKGTSQVAGPWMELEPKAYANAYAKPTQNIRGG